MGVEDNQVLLKLVIRGMDPDEVQRLADQTYGQLKSEAATHIEALTAFYKQQTQAQTDAAKEAAQEKIDAETQALDAVTKLMRQQEVEANKARNAWHGVMEDLENITTVATGAWEVMQGGFERFERLAENITKTTNIYGALKGSIDQMREATEGEVADVDLITAKNRGFQESLRVTDEQYGSIAAAAHNFAKVLGVDTKEALDKLVTGLATGRVRTLEMVGVTVNADEANRRYAESIGKTVDQLTDHDKKNALLQESLRAMDRKIVETGLQVTTFANTWEKSMAQIKNATDQIFLWIGNRIQDVIEGFTIILPNQIKIAIAKIKDLVPGVNEHYEDQARAALGAELEAYEKGGGQKQIDDAKARLADPNAYKGATTGFGTDKAPKAGAAYEPFGAGGEGAAFGGKTHQATFDFEGLFAPRATDSSVDDYIKAAEKADAEDEKRAITIAKVKGLTIDAATAYQKLATSLGLEVEALTHEEKMQAISNEQKVQSEKFAKEQKAKADALRAELKATKDKAGIMGLLLWGEQGPDQTYKQMDEFTQHMVDTFGQMSGFLTSAAQSMSNAIGKSIAATVEGAAGHRASLKQMTHDALDAIAQQALIKAVWEVAEGVASIAMYNFPGAALHFAAAAAYGAVGVAAGLGARAIGTSPAAGATAPHPSAGTSTSSAGNQGASGSRSSTTTNSGPSAPVTINMTVMPGGEADAGRSVKKALDALNKQTGQPLLVSH